MTVNFSPARESRAGRVDRLITAHNPTATDRDHSSLSGVSAAPPHTQQTVTPHTHTHTPDHMQGADRATHFDL